MRSVWLMYHDVFVSEPDAAIPRTSAMYHVSRAMFARHVAAIRESGRRTITAGETPAADSVAITFDDGWHGAFTIALPMLAEAGMRATFYVTRDFVGRTHMAGRQLIADAAAAGMEIGVHGTTHRMLSGLSRDEIFQELAQCRGFLEDLTGKRVEHASLPGGDVSDEIVAEARRAGLASLSTSRPGINTRRTSRFRLRRIGIRMTTTEADVARYCRFRTEREQARWLLLQAPRTMLGMKNYSRLRRLLLDRGREQHHFKP